MSTLAKVVISVTLAVLIGGLAALSVSYGGYRSQTSSQISQLQDANRQLAGQVARDQAKLNAQSVTGDLITCTDLRGYSSNAQVSVYGSDVLGESVTGTGSVSNSWLPSHCYKQ